MDILRHESNGIEFFTVQATGESGISYSGLAVLCGVNQSSITRLITKLEGLTSCVRPEEKDLESSNHNGFNPMRNKGVERLKAFIGKDLHLEGAYKKKGGEVKILKAEFCAATIKHYALEGREIAELSMDKFMTLGINSWIQSITGWQIEPEPIPVNATTSPNSNIDLQTPTSANIDCHNLLSQIDLLKNHLKVALKHRHAIHNIVEKPTVVDLSLNQIIHTAVHVQAQKLNQALIALQAIRSNIKARQTLPQQLHHQKDLSEIHPQHPKTVGTIIAELRQENINLKQVIQQQKLLVAPRRKVENLATTSQEALAIALEPRIKEITSILMKSQKRKRAISTCTRKATIYALYELGQGLKEISISLQMPYETVKTYVKLTREDIRSYYSEEN